MSVASPAVAMNPAQLIHQDSGNVEWYTPQFIVDAARDVMRAIDLDPASSERANLRIRAASIYTIEDDGLTQPWHGCVWLNHPFGRRTNRSWIEKAVSEFRSGRVRELCCITFSATSEAWFAPLMAFPQCYLRPRTNYYTPDGSKVRGVTKGSVVTYMGRNAGWFCNRFRALGSVMLPA